MRNLVIPALAAIAAAASAARAQSITFHWHWNRASDPITAPAPAALLPGESARVWLDISFSPPAGSLINIKNAPYFVRGLASFTANLDAVNAADGVWVGTGTGFGGTPLSPFQNVNAESWGHREDTQPDLSAWNLLGVANWGSYHQGNLSYIQGGQLAGGPPNLIPAPDNNLIELWRGRFTPDSYEPRTIAWSGRVAGHHTGTGASLYVMPAAGGPIFSHSIPAFNISPGTLEIPVIPSPSAFTLLGIGCVHAARRRRAASPPFPGARVRIASGIQDS